MWETTTDARAFLDAAGAFLRSRPVEHTVLLTVSERLTREGAPDGLLGWWAGGDGRVAGAFLHTPPYGVLVAAPPEAAAELGGQLRGAGRAVDAVNAEDSVAEGFARGFGARRTAVHQRHRLHRLAELVPPDPPPSGAARMATEADREVLEAWVTAFGDEAADRMADVAGMVADRVAHGGFLLWEDGAPVSLAASNRAIEGVVRIGPVYTPPEARRRGYAAGVTAAAAAAALADGAREVLLFTDMANPTSNALYRRLGFEPLEDRVLLDLTT
jgi:ribosomal protein S18 acetylase RimI-like enzyme